MNIAKLTDIALCQSHFVRLLRQGLCGGMVSGVHFMVNIFRPELENLKICLPQKNTEGQVLSVVIQWLKAHPEQRARPASIPDESIYEESPTEVAREMPRLHWSAD